MIEYVNLNEAIMKLLYIDGVNKFCNINEVVAESSFLQEFFYMVLLPSVLIFLGGSLMFLRLFRILFLLLLFLFLFLLFCFLKGPNRVKETRFV